MPPLMWTQIQDIGPPARARHAIAYGEGSTLLFGGVAGATFFGDTWEWDGENWVEVADIGPAARLAHVAAHDSLRKRLVLFGGEGEAGAFLGDTWEWDGDWTQIQDVGPAPRSAHAAAFDPKRGRVVLFGGADASASLLADTWSWDGANWVEIADIGPAARAGHVLAYDATREVVVLFGGVNANGDLLGDTWTWDGEEWTQAQDVGPPPTRDAALSPGGAELVLFGGLIGEPPQPSRNTWSWDGSDWTQRQNMGPSARSGHAMTFDALRGRVIAFGGLDTGVAVLGDTWELPTADDPGEPILSEARLLAFQVAPASVSILGGSFTLTARLAAPVGNTVAVIVESNVDDTARREILIPAGATEVSTQISAGLPPGPRTYTAHIEGDSSGPKTANVEVRQF